MTNEELAKLDPMIAIERMLISNNAMLKTVLQAQMLILKELNPEKNHAIAQDINDWVIQNINAVSEELIAVVPKSMWINYPTNYFQVAAPNSANYAPATSALSSSPTSYQVAQLDMPIP